MARNKLGSHTFRPESPVYITNWAAVVGKKEAEGPLGHGFDIKSMDTRFGERTWEKAEKKMQQLALYRLLDKARLSTGDLDLVFSGDLLNQCIGSSFTLRNTGIPHLGLYGACSTMAESLLLASMAVGGGYADRAVALTSSHFAGSERQYRFPLGYGGQRTPTAQWTVTGSGAALVTCERGNVCVESATIGTVTDLGVTDAANMGAAMAPVDDKLRPSPNGGMHTGYTHIHTAAQTAAPFGSCQNRLPWTIIVPITPAHGDESPDRQTEGGPAAKSALRQYPECSFLFTISGNYGIKRHRIFNNDLSSKGETYGNNSNSG